MKIDNIRIKPNYSELELATAIAEKLKIDPKRVSSVLLLKKSVDARHKPNISLVLSAEIALDGKICSRKITGISVPRTKSDMRPVIIGSGPAGLFSALTFVKAGLKPIIIERGADCDTRKSDIETFYKTANLNTESNMQFGEGGAGAFSDGKLNTGINSPIISAVFEELVLHGAPEEILYLAKPHIGTDRLIPVLKNIRKYLTENGAEYYFNTKLTDITTINKQLKSVALTGKHSDVLNPKALILAIGHSARDTYEMLLTAGIKTEKKPFAIGVRIEHTQEFINTAMYGAKNVSGLGSADYKLAVQTTDGHGLFSFCMCPGGFVSAAASECDGLVTNGMSFNARDGRNANSALLTSVRETDVGDGLLSGIEFQRKYERLAYELGGKNYNAPIQLASDFISNKISSKLGTVAPTYPIGTTLCNLQECLPDFVSKNLGEGLLLLDKKISGFIREGLLTGVETRTSAPLRVLRDDFYMSNITGIYPVGEGAGYAGGITSSAVDGVKAAQSILKSL